VPLKQRISDLRAKIQEKLQEAQEHALTKTMPWSPPVVAGEEPPVVARLMVEIRSDGSTTIARGAIEDIASGDRVAIEARGTTPTQLAASLAKAIFSTPLLARTAMRAMLDGRRGNAKPVGGSGNGNGND
jgi:hypothetical protein